MLTKLLTSFGALALVSATTAVESSDGPVVSDASDASDISDVSAAPTGTVRSQDIEFLTKLVSDANANIADYFMFSRTADIEIPGFFGSVAGLIKDYSDDSYTTLLEDPNFPIHSIESFATHLDWYSSRLAVDGVQGSSGSETETSSEDLATPMYAPLGLALVAAVVGLL